MANNEFRCLLAEKEFSEVKLREKTLPLERLPSGDVTIDVHYSSLNYKDALAATGNPGVAKSLPHVPGIDAVGIVLESHSGLIQVGQWAIVTGYNLGQGHWGGWSEKIRVPAEWVLPLPTNLSPRDAMIYGTAGFTAAQCVLALRHNDLKNEMGEVVVTGATGGVGSMAVRLLAQLGYQVVAVTGKPQMTDRLLAWGARRVIQRNDLIEPSKRPMLSAQWAGAIDTVGGTMLSNLLRSTKYGGCVAACGLVAGAQLEMSLYPFLLRGITLCGIASADCPREKRLRIWDLLTNAWRVADLEQLATEVSLAEVPDKVTDILDGKIVGRVLVNVKLK